MIKNFLIISKHVYLYCKTLQFKENRRSHRRNLTCFYLYRKYSRRLEMIINQAEKVKNYFIFPIRSLMAPDHYIQIIIDRYISKVTCSNVSQKSQMARTKQRWGFL